MSCEYPHTIEEAALLMDKDRPGWEWYVNLNKLDMENTDMCILGQTGGYFPYVDLYRDDGGYLPQRHIAIWGSMASIEEWAKEIDERRNRDTISDTELVVVKYANSLVWQGPHPWKSVKTDLPYISHIQRCIPVDMEKVRNRAAYVIKQTERNTLDEKIKKMQTELAALEEQRGQLD